MKKQTREFNYKNTTSKYGEFSARIKDKKLVKELEAYCLITNTNKTKYVIEAIREKLMFDMDDLKTEYKQKKFLEEQNGD